MAVGSVERIGFEKVPEPPSELRAFVERQVRNARLHVGPERRCEPRQLLVVPVLVQPVDPQLRPIGQPFTVVSRDISPGGVGLAHCQRIDQKLLAIQMQIVGETVKALVEVLWNRPMGPFEYIGARFLKRLDRFPGADHCR